MGGGDESNRAGGKRGVENGAAGRACHRAAAPGGAYSKVAAHKRVWWVSY